MNRRIVFKSKEVRDNFFNQSLKLLNLRNWKQLSLFLNVNRNILTDYRHGELTLPERIYFKLILKFDERDISFFNQNISYLDETWGRVKGGKTTYRKYRELFEMGRRKAIHISVKRAHKFNTSIPLDEKLSYFLGLFVGDGFTNKYQRYHIIQFTGDKRSERDFYRDLITQYSRELFNLAPTIYECKDTNALRFNLYSKELFHLITQRFKISAGRKSHSVLIPQQIIESSPEIIKAFIRGLYDAEGCVFFDKRDKYAQPYVRIDLHMCNLSLLKQVSDILELYGVHCNLRTVKDNLRVTIYGEEQVKRFLKEVGFSNPKHLKKLDGLI